MLYRHKFFKIILTHLAKHDILCHKSHWFCGLVWNHPQNVVVFILNTATESGWLSPWDPPLQWGKVRKRIYRPATHLIYFAAVSPDKIIAALRGRYFSFRELHLENFMSRPNVIPTFRQRRCTNRGRNFVRSKRWPTYTSSGTLYLFLHLNNSETFVENAFWAQR